MKRKPPLPDPITWTRQNVGRIAVNGAPPRWMARLPNGSLVYLGHTREECKLSLLLLNKLAALCGNHWDGILAVTIGHP